MKVACPTIRSGREVWAVFSEEGGKGDGAYEER